MRLPDECERCGHKRHSLPCDVRYIDTGWFCGCTEVSDEPTTRTYYTGARVEETLDGKRAYVLSGSMIPKRTAKRAVKRATVRKKVGRG